MSGTVIVSPTIMGKTDSKEARKGFEQLNDNGTEFVLEYESLDTDEKKHVKCTEIIMLGENLASAHGVNGFGQEIIIRVFYFTGTVKIGFAS